MPSEIVMTRMNLVAMLLAVLAVAGGPGTLDRRAVAEEKKAENDADRIQGHWVSSQGWVDGRELPARPLHCVFTDKEVKLFSGWAWQYHLDPTQTPKHLDLRHQFTGLQQRGIYRFEGDKLRICLPTSVNINDPRPEDFIPRPSDKHYVILAERGKPNPDGRPSLSRGFALADSKLADELHARVSHAADLLEKNRWADFLKDLIPPDESVGRDKTPLPKNFAAGLAKTLRAMEKKIPAVNHDGTWAYFDLQDVHFNDTPGKPLMFFRKVEGRWYPTERHPPAPPK
jgi:uncharacterized protein (TIGR03067 family)